MAKKMKKETKESAAKKVKENNKSVLQNEPIFRFDRNNACMIVEFEDGKQITIQFSGLEFAAFLLKVTNEIYCSKNNIKKRYRLDDLGNKLQEFHKLLENIDTEWLIAFKRSARFQENSNTTQDARWALSEARRKMREEFEKLGIAKEEADSLVAKILPGWNDEMEYPVDKIKLEGVDPFLEAAKGQLVFKEYGVILSKDCTEIKLIPDGIEGEFKIPETVTKLEGDIFKKCKKITSILIPESVISIGKYVFSGCEKLEHIEVAEENPVYKSINGMILNKEGTELILVPKCIKGEFHIPEGVKQIGGSAFDTGLTSITIPKSVIKITGFGSKESIWGNPFRDCNRLKRIEVAEENPVYKSIEGMLLNKEGMELILVPKGIKGNLQIPEGVKKIGERVFYNCTGLTSITIPKSVTDRIEWDSFEGCTELEHIEVVEGNSKYESINGMLLSGMMPFRKLIYVPKGIKGELYVPEGVIEIGEGAFYNCTGLTSIIIPESVDEIGEGAFVGCDSLEEIYFRGNEPVIEAPRDKDGELWVEKNLFSHDHNKNLKLYYRKGTKGWGYTFDGLPIEVKKDAVIEKQGVQFELYENKTATVKRCGTHLTGNVVIPLSIKHNGVLYSVTEIDRKAFEDCIGLTNIEIPEGVTEIGSSAFENCIGLGSITIPKNVTIIDVAVFKGCRGLTNITIPESVTKIGWDAFSGCTGLTSITIPKSVTEIGFNSFDGCTGLENIEVVKENTKYENINGMLLSGNEMFLGKIKYELIYVSKGIKGELYIPEGVTMICDYAFHNCTELNRITIPECVTEIGWGAFSGCTSLREIHFEGDAPNCGCDVFENVQATIYYRKGTKGWGKTFEGLPTQEIDE